MKELNNGRPSSTEITQRIDAWIYRQYIDRMFCDLRVAVADRLDEEAHGAASSRRYYPNELGGVRYAPTYRFLHAQG
jgi:hypothetical protein